MKGGMLDKRVIVQKVIETFDSFGGANKVWDTQFIRWARIAPNDGAENYTNDQPQAHRFVKITMRYDENTKNITPKYRITYLSRVFDIESVTNVREENKEIMLICREIWT